MSEELTEVILPLMGEGITEASLVKWLKQPGDKVEKDEPLVEVSTDKVDTEIGAPDQGYLLKTYANEGDNIAVNGIIAYLGKSADASAPDQVESPAHGAPSTAQGDASQSNGASAAPLPPMPAQPIAQFGEVRSSPLVRKMARDMNLNLAAIAGRGAAGRITKKDVLNFVDKVTESMGLRSGIPETPALQTSHVDGKELLEGVPVRREPMSKMRRLIAEHMVRSVSTSPHVTTTFEIDMHRLVELRGKHVASFSKQEGFKITYTHLLAHAAVQAIKKNPIVNVSVDGTDILFKDDINLGLAVAIDSGLIVPVIRRANEMSLLELCRATNDIVIRSRSKKLNPEDVQGGTFSITNPGLFGSLNSQPIINQPQVAILSVGTITKRPVVIDDEIAIRPLIQIGLTFDHRVVDGEGGAKFLKDLKEIIENYDESPT